VKKYQVRKEARMEFRMQRGVEKESHTALTSHKTPFFIVTAVKNSNLTETILF
jgi:hypothetical protein